MSFSLWNITPFPAKPVNTSHLFFLPFLCKTLEKQNPFPGWSFVFQDSSYLHSIYQRRQQFQCFCLQFSVLYLFSVIRHGHFHLSILPMCSTFNDWQINKENTAFKCRYKPVIQIDGPNSFSAVAGKYLCVHKSRRIFKIRTPAFNSWA